MININLIFVLFIKNNISYKLKNNQLSNCKTFFRNE